MNNVSTEATDNNDIIDFVSTHFSKEYLSEINTYEIVKADKKQDQDYGEYSIFQILSISYDKKSDLLNKLSTVYSTVYNHQSKLLLIINALEERIDFYIGTKSEDDILDKSLTSQFGIGMNSSLDADRVKELVDKVIVNEKISYISSYVGIPSLKNENHELFSQGLESLVDVMRGQKYTAMFIADPIDRKSLRFFRHKTEEMYSALSPLENIRNSFGENESEQVSTSISESISSTLSGKTNKGKKGGVITIAAGGGIGYGMIATGLITATGGSAAPIVLGGAMLAGTVANVLSDTTSKGQSKTKVEGKSVTKGESSSYDMTFTDKKVSNLLKKLDLQCERIKNSENLGMFHSGCYFLSDEPSTAKLASSTFKALMQGNESHVEDAYIINWDDGDEEKREHVKKSLSMFEHPIFALRKDFPPVSPAVFLNTNEIALMFGLPRKSVSGIVVKQSVEFGRNVPEIKEKDESILLGSLIHLGEEQGTNVELGKKSLAMHTLITGSTGSGKSTTTYKLIDEIREKSVKFLVIEPTKGEYKHIYGNNDDIYVYGTNCQYTPLLKINPFSFPYNKIHVLEHVDRLVEIFNACWPMYAAMPAILKDAILESYEVVGWDLDDSKNSQNNNFPSFMDVVDCLEELLESSFYSDNTKADYKGALITRVKSLTQGIIKNILTEDCISDKDLFDENVIVDLSRIGSSETKSLIMGILMLKLSEYRMSEDGMRDEDLKHVTILEEAHHILPRVSTQTSQESGNIKGKAVEMLSNAIAEMRTYGEGFIIVDQSPNMLDISAIRNTNTKIIMRLSEIEDRNDIGKSAALSDDQINEIPKLPVGVAIIYQNGWEEAVLCRVKNDVVQVDETDKEKEQPKYINQNPCEVNKKNISKIIKYLVIKDTHILENEQREVIEEFGKDEELKKYLAITSLKEKVRVVQELIEAREIKNTKNVTFKQISEKLRKKILVLNMEYEKLLVNYILIDLSHKTLDKQLNQLQMMIDNKSIEDFITLAIDKKIRRLTTREGEIS